MKKYSRILYLIIILGLIFNYSRVDNTKQIKRIVESKNYLTVAAEAGFESEELYRCVLDTLGSNRTSATDEELSQITEIICRSQNITSTKGIEKLTSLRYLNLYDNKVTNMDLSKNTNLVMLNMTFNNLSSIDLSKNTNLQQLYLNGNNITSIDLSNNNKLIDLNLYNNKLTSINVSNLTELKFLLLSLNNLTNLDLKNNNKLEHVYLSGNQLSNLVLPVNGANLTKLDLNANKVGDTLDFSKYINLSYLIVSANNISKLDVSNNNNLEYLYSSSNQIKNIDLSNNTKLIDLDLYGNQLKEIDLSKLSNLRYLNLSLNKLTSLDLTSQQNLNALYVSSNQLSSLSLENQKELTEINAVFNYFSGYNINNKGLIKYMAIDDEWLDKTNLKEYTALSKLGLGTSKVIPVYGTTFNIDIIDKHLPTNVKFNQYKIYHDYALIDNNRKCAYEVVHDIEGSSEKDTTRIDICNNKEYTTQIINGNDGDYFKFLVHSDDVELENDLTNIDIEYNGYYEVRLIKISSNKYIINEENNTIEVEADDDSTILKNLSTSWEDAKITIHNNKLQISYNDTLIKEFSLIRITNPKTGSTNLLITIFIFIVSLSTIMLYLKQKRKTEHE